MSKKTIVITGAAGGVGSMLAMGLAKKGNHIVCLGRSKHALQELSDKINSESQTSGGSASFDVLDMMDTEAVSIIGERIKQEFKQIDVWINNVGVNNHNAIGPTWELKAEDWWNEISFNLFTAYQGTATAIRLMKNNSTGYIINLGGGGVQEPKPFGSAYGAAKTAIVKFTETINIELEQENLNIKAFVFNPGFIKNDRTELLVESEVAQKYMPKLEEILKHGVMSDAQDSINLIDSIITGQVDNLAGRYFFADDKNIADLIENNQHIIEQELHLLRVNK